MSKWFRAELRFLPAKNWLHPQFAPKVLTGSRTHRWPWDLGARRYTEGEVNDAGVTLLDRAELNPGEAAMARIEPLFPERWVNVKSGDVIRAGLGFAEATILEVADE